MLLAVKSEIPSCGFIRGNSSNTITKHDKNLSERRNTEKIMEVNFCVCFIS